VFSVIEATRRAIEHASSGKGPVLIEALTYRLSGHSTSDDPKAYRKNEEVERWKSRDPMLRLRKYLDERSLWNDEKQSVIEAEFDAEIAAAVKQAEETPAPGIDSMFEEVFAELPWHLVEQRAQLRALPRAKGHGGH
jgi:2-oxoisovalerate dehydrogenase E1 component alpha subunit